MFLRQKNKTWLTGKDLGAGKDWGQEGERGNRGWDDWMAPSTRWTWVWANSGRYWRTGKPGVLQSMGSQTRLSDWSRRYALNQSVLDSWTCRNKPPGAGWRQPSGKLFPHGHAGQRSGIKVWLEELIPSRGSEIAPPPCLFPAFGAGNGNPLQSPCLENPMDRGA